MKHTLNENIKQLRLQQGLSQVKFAQVMCVTKQCVSNWENDNVLPSIEMLVKMADFFSVTTDFLLGRSTNTTIVADGLSEEQQTHLRQIVLDLQLANQQAKKNTE